MASVSVTIRNVPDHVRDELAARANRSGRSLQEDLLRQLTTLASRPAAEDVIVRARQRVRTTGTLASPLVTLDARLARASGVRCPVLAFDAP